VVAYYRDDDAARPDAIGLNVSTWDGAEGRRTNIIECRLSASGEP
jgi:hypothetical protein